MQSSVRRFLALTACFGLVLLVSSTALAQFYTRHNLVSNQAGKAGHMDALLGNPWGIAYGPGAPFWISDEATGWSTLYDGQGNLVPLQVIIPPASGTGAGTPTGIVYNGSSEFQIDSWTSVFLFATLDGTISGWSHFNPSAALIGATQAGAVYTGLAITNRTSGNLLYAADTANNKVDVYDGSFNLVNSFTDATIPVGFSVFGIQDIGGQVYVTFASASGQGPGYIDIFGEDGTFVKRFSHAGRLSNPWGMTMAPSKFGPLSGTLLVSNNTSTGTIVGLDPTTGKFVGTVKNSTGKDLWINGLWGIEFGGGTTANGKVNQLFFTAGPSSTDGYFGLIAAQQ